MEPGAPVLHDKDLSSASDNIFCDIHGEVGSVAEGFADADAVHEMTYSTTRVQHVHLETHGSIAWTGDDDRSMSAPARKRRLSPSKSSPTSSDSRATFTCSPNASAAGSAASRR